MRGGGLDLQWSIMVEFGETGPGVRLGGLILGKELGKELRYGEDLRPHILCLGKGPRGRQASG